MEAEIAAGNAQLTADGREGLASRMEERVKNPYMFWGKKWPLDLASDYSDRAVAEDEWEERGRKFEFLA